MQKYLALYADSHNMIKFNNWKNVPKCVPMFSKAVTFPYQTWTKERSHEKYTTYTVSLFDEQF